MKRKLDKGSHALTKLRTIYRETQKEFLDGQFSTTYIGNVERGISKITPELSEKIIAKYGAWIRPGYNTTGLYEAFGEKWSRSLPIIEKMKLGPVIEAGKYQCCADLSRHLEDERKKLFGKRTVNKLHVMPGTLDLVPFTDESEGSRALALFEDENDKVAGGTRQSIDNEKLGRIISFLLEESEEGSAYASLFELVEKLCKDSKISAAIRSKYNRHLNSLAELFPGKGLEHKRFIKQLMKTAELKPDVIRKSNAGASRLFIESLVTPGSFHFFRDWRVDGMDAETWQYLYHQTCATLGKK